MHLVDLMIRYTAAVIVAAALMPVPAAAAEGSRPAAAVTVDTGSLVDEQQAEERAQMQRLRRARQQHEANRAEAARKLEAGQARQAAINRLRSAALNLERRESFLHHDATQLQQELHLISRDPADHSAIARRSELERQSNHRQLQLHQTTTSKDDAMRRREQLRFR